MHFPLGKIGPKLPNTSFALNRNSPQAKGLRIWFPPMASRSGILRDLILGNLGVLVSGTYYRLDRDIGYSTYHTSTGTNDRVEISDNPSLDITEPFSLTAWVRPFFTNGAGVQSSAKIISKPSTSNSSPYIVYSLGTDASSPAKFALYISTNAGSAVGVIGTKTISAYQFYHACGTYDGAIMRLYVNGLADGTNNISISVGTTARPLCLGRLSDGIVGNNMWYGNIGDVRIYDRALSASEVWQLYDPATRWDLYKPIISALWSPPQIADTRVFGPHIQVI